MRIAADIAAVIVTRNRRSILRETLLAVRASRVRPGHILVVDNGGSDGTPDMLAREFPEVELLALAENTGYPGGLDAGMRHACAQGFAAFWLMDDDSRPSPDALGSVLSVAESVSGWGVVGQRGGTLRWGLVKHLPADELGPRVPGAEAVRADFTLVDGALVSRAAVERVGTPRPDFFMMLEDLEYTYRCKRAGLEVLVVDEDRMARGHLGSGGGHTSTPPWRGYYQTRNQLRMALDLRSPVLLSGWAVRQAKFLVGTLLWLDRKTTRLAMRARGAWDGLRGRMGRTVDPAQWS